MTNVTEAFWNLGIALGLGLLVGLQRERVATHLAGVRTFPLITVLGTLSAMMTPALGGWIVAAALLGVIAAMVLGNMSALRSQHDGAGITTEVTIVVMFLVGALVWVGPREVAVAVGGCVLLLLHAKGFLHGFAQKLGDKDVRAIMTFVVISFIILPVLPNQNYGPAPIDVLNPKQIWLMVVLVVGMSFGGYAVYKLLGERAGIALGGLLGGAVSSTATTVSYANRSRGAAAHVLPAAVVIALASSVTYARVLTEVAVVAPNYFSKFAAPIGALWAFALLLAGIMWLAVRRQKNTLPEQENPTELKSALFFGGMYACVLVAVAFARDRFGDSGLYVVSALSGTTNTDAITLSTARLVQEGRLEVDQGWRAIIISILANQMFKASVVAVLGSGRLFLTLLPVFMSTIAAAVTILALWPGHT